MVIIKLEDNSQPPNQLYYKDLGQSEFDGMGDAKAHIVREYRINLYDTYHTLMNQDNFYKDCNKGRYKVGGDQATVYYIVIE